MSQVVKTVNELITNSLYLLGELGTNETPDSFMLSTGLELINEILAMYDSDSIYIPYLTELNFNLVVAQASYVISDMVPNPDVVADAADWPVNEADQHARHLWLVSQEQFREQMKVDPDFYDAKIAGWWVWGQCIWIGSGWCAKQLPHLGDAGRGVNRQLPHLGDAGTGGDECLSYRTSGTREFLFQYMNELAKRLRRVRVCCGDWSRVCGPTPTVKLGTTGVFLDPPYLDGRTDALYSTDSLTVAHEVREWAIAQGDDPLIRIALCGYEGEHDMPGSWDCVEWKARGGYGSQGENRARENSSKERVYFSPHCLRPAQERLFA